MNYSYHHYFSFTGNVLKGVRGIYEILTDIENCQIGEGLYTCASAALCARARPMASVVVIPVYKASRASGPALPCLSFQSTPLRPLRSMIPRVSRSTSLSWVRIPILDT
jgi:hypothetical protein